MLYLYLRFLGLLYFIFKFFNLKHPLKCLIFRTSENWKKIVKYSRGKHLGCGPARAWSAVTQTTRCSIYAFIRRRLWKRHPNRDRLDTSLKHLISIDDLMPEVNEAVTSLFTKKSHHRNISVICMVQNIIHQKQWTSQYQLERVL